MKKILFVEDDKFLVKIYGAKLKREGLESDLLENGEGVVEKLESKNYCLVVLDLMMPVKDGFVTLKEIKQNPKTKEVPVLVLTALKSDRDKKTCMDLGADEYLVKTDVSFKEIMRKIRGYLGE